MSTRSRKRIHDSLQENVDVVFEATDNNMIGILTEKKTRSRRIKQNTEDEKYDYASKKKHNYVAYPENNDNNADEVAPVPRGKTRKSRRNILQEHDINEITKEMDTEGHDLMNRGRFTRQTKKFNDVQEIENTEVIHVSNKKNTNKKLKNKKQLITCKDNEVVDTKETIITKNKSKKKKKGKKMNTNTNAVDGFITDKTKKSLNKSGMSEDSFHSAAGSSVSEGDVKISSNRHNGELLTAETNSKHIMYLHEEISCTKPRKCKNTMKGDMKVNNNKRKYDEESHKMITLHNENIEQKCNTLKSSIKPSNSDVIKKTIIKGTTNVITVEPSHTTINKIDMNIVKIKTLNGSVLQESLSTSFNDKEVVDTFECSNSATKQRRSKRLSLLDPETPSHVTKHPNKINKTLSDKKHLDRTIENSTQILDSTFDKENEKIHKAPTNSDTTFDKSDEQTNTKSSLISSDSEHNSTYNKTNDISRISITSEESKTENIVNTTPMLIESSLDNTQLEYSTTYTDHNKTEIPLKREGTFTKDDTGNTKDTSLLSKRSNTSSDSVTTKTPKKDSLTKTPDKGTPLGTPGSTPFPFSKTSQKKSVLNVTHSIEKTSRLSVVASAPRATRVMFCSPVDFPQPSTESKRRIVKSSVKGSNKSFVFDDSECTRPSPAMGRKRSFTHEENGQRAKRTRLADDQLQSVERLSRPRTNSATGKLGNGTPGNKPATPPSRPRTKLPNFAALHQKQFAKMESLDECQERKAKRAKQLLVPTGSVAVLDRTSPKATDSPRKSKEPSRTKKFDTIPKQGDTNLPSYTRFDTIPKQGDTNLPSYTRFGFKMNIAGVVNPFTMPPKESSTVGKPKEMKSNGANTRITLPSRTGGTVVRKDVAKQIIMREKSFTSLSSKRDSKRTQNRTIIKGVRTNRRFELQMQMRNLDA